MIGLFISMTYDLIWFALLADTQATNDIGDGGRELWVRKFSLYMAYLHFFFKVITAFVYWKTSVDFERLREVRASRVFRP